ncbi:2-oxo-4-hydroxy-4-carboxy-5-ureidoimidazoline decarboxylase [Deinococcus cellulosilyticus]|uniref:2-oxo-4-hydroxy-4-carboxy-5-ureidoimidazoline decarboxylase n=1 Tax=Deinococcus cellulosilyticus (strain DSM 18568 / NBRC 106333 / KACC 11606 / 5516J-15) TaxID=1223518 RepID=A0A511NBW3_DEIC1|nr:2-oxo-4-hydroxy-4-carboxy-5-ureidoimidazoline decarboxylase [Deinococcus cellulosilyticus]GEM50087.1 2-oxo-4-hydroxy-4-carboxy-5-ureidoimidazoline decarboxylase [Deinococcus cellulosilyticus NBRC 106333 = KACC 11606]
MLNFSTIETLDRESFVRELGWLFEHSPWVVERAANYLPFKDVDGVLWAFNLVLQDASMDEQLSLIRAHPDLATKAKLTDASQQEQGSVGLDRLDPTRFELFQKLNSAYKSRFGFPFIIAVKDNTVDTILQAFEVRLMNDADSERREALRQIERIVFHRLKGALGDAH